MENVWHSSGSRLGLRVFLSLICLLGNICLDAEEMKECPSVCNNPFKGIEKFTVFVLPVTANSEQIAKEFVKLGNVKRLSLSDKKGVDFSGFSQNSLFFSVIPLHTLDDEQNDFAIIRLTFATTVEIQQTKNQIVTDVWSKELVTRKERIASAVHEIYMQFAKEFTDINPQIKPTFWIYL